MANPANSEREPDHDLPEVSDERYADFGRRVAAFLGASSNWPEGVPTQLGNLCDDAFGTLSPNSNDNDAYWGQVQAKIEED
jgi:hypothetical protein